MKTAPNILALADALAHMDIGAAQMLLHELQSIDVAEALEQLPVESSSLILMQLPKRAKVYAAMHAAYQARLAKLLSRADLATIVTEMPADKRTDVFKALAPSEQVALLPALAQAKREDLRRLAEYQEGTAGAIMTSEYATLRAEMSIAEAIDFLRQEAPDAETIYESYIIDEQQQLLGEISLHQLILAPVDANVGALMATDIVYAYVDDDQDDVAKKIARYDLLALPIIDRQHRLVGIVTYDDAMDVASEEANEDFLKSAGVEASAPTLNLKQTPLFQLYKKRVFWLVILVFGSLLSGLGIAHFESIIESNIVLVFFCLYWWEVAEMQVLSRLRSWCVHWRQVMWS